MRYSGRHRGWFRWRRVPGEWGGRFLTPNAHRCLHQTWKNIRVAWRELRAALRWQWRGF
jgi:hypothetical protein